MRVGKWVPLYKRKLPIPRRLAMAFGLAEGSILHLVPITDEADRQRHGFEIIASPVPPDAWRTACRLSVRLHDEPRSLVTATDYLRNRKINILFSESSSTFRHRAHWDVICDIRHSKHYQQLESADHGNYHRRMKGVLEALNLDLSEYMDASGTRAAFLQDSERYGEFTALTGLNDAAFLTTTTAPKPAATYTAGGIEIDEALANIVSVRCLMEPPRLPDYAMITGNTEQRYLRVLFLRDYQSLFRVIIKNTTTHFAGGGIGIINQILAGLPSEINLLRTATRITDRDDRFSRGWTEIIGHWDTGSVELESKSDYMKAELHRVIPQLELKDIEGVIHKNALQIVDFASPETLYPRVFVSYSTRSDPAKLTYLLNMLWDNHFRPVVGTDLNRSIRRRAGRLPTSVDVVEAAFEAIPGCVALVSLQLIHPDFHITDQRGRSGYIVPPWAVAEEVYAWSLGLGRVIRIRHIDVEEPRYNYHIQTFRFSSDDEFPRAVDGTIAELNAFRAAKEFGEFKDEARRSQYVPWHPPGDV